MNLLELIKNDYLAHETVLRDFDRHYTYGELHVRCEKLSAQLQKNKVTSLALHADNGIDWIVVDLVCQQAGIRMLPLPTFFTPTQIVHALTSCSIKTLVTDDPRLLSSLDLELTESPLTLAAGKLSLGRFSTAAEIAELPVGTEKITFTSGSTGTPKGVCFSHAQLLQQATILANSVSLPRPRHLCVLPLSTLLENVAGAYAPLLVHGEVIVPALKHLGFEGSRLIDKDKFLAALAGFEPDSIILIPELLQLLVMAVSNGWQPPASLKFIAVGGSKVPEQLLLQAIACKLPVFEGYGLSECASVVCLNTDGQNRPGSCGKPLENTLLRMDKGEVVVTGNTMLGYVNEPDSWNQLEIHTGDLGQLDAEGFLHLQGRKKNLLISSYGRNISPEWVESEILANPQILDAVVFGDAKPYCVALLCARSRQYSDLQIQDWLNSVNLRLPDYAQVKSWFRTDQGLASLNGMLTDNGRPKRHCIEHYFANEIERLYHDLSAINA